MRSHGLRALVGTGVLGPLVLGAAGLLTLVGLNGAADAAPKTDPVNLTQFIGPDFFAALVVHPSRLAKATMLTGLSQPDMSNMIKSGPPEASLAAEFFKAEKIRRIVVLVASTAEGGVGWSHFTVGAIFQFNEDVDSESFLKAVAKDAEPVTLEGVTYLTSKSTCFPANPAAKTPAVPMAACVAGPRTLLIAMEPAMKKMLAPATGPQTLLEQLKHSSLDNDVLLQIVAEPLLKSEAGAMLKAAAKAEPNHPFSQLMDDVKSIALALNVTKEPLLKLAVTGAKPDSADKFAGLMQVAKMGIVASLDGAKKKPSPMLPPELKEPLFKVADEIVAALQVAKQGDEVTLTIAQPPTLPALVQKLPEAVKNIAMMFGQGGPVGPGASGLPDRPAAKPPAANADPFAPSAAPAAKSSESKADPFAPSDAPAAKPSATPAPSSEHQPKNASDLGGPTLSDVKVLRTSQSPVKVVFSLRIRESADPVGEMWACLGGRVDLVTIMVGSQRQGLLGASSPGFATRPCKLQKPTKASEPWTAEVEFPESSLLKSKVPVALMLDDEKGRKSNPVVVEVDFGGSP
jgi:hypothetical protein